MSTTKKQLAKKSYTHAEVLDLVLSTVTETRLALFDEHQAELVEAFQRGYEAGQREGYGAGYVAGVDETLV